MCPALFDLGERAKIVLFSATEGEEMPTKYRTCSAPRAYEIVRAVNRQASTLQLSASIGEGCGIVRPAAPRPGSSAPRLLLDRRRWIALWR